MTEILPIPPGSAEDRACCSSGPLTSAEEQVFSPRRTALVSAWIEFFAVATDEEIIGFPV